MTTVSVIVPARDCGRTLPAVLDAVAGQREECAVEVIVVDNGSRDGTAALAEAHPAVDRLVRRPRGDGPGAARNEGAASARGDVLAFTDADCVPEPGWLAGGLAALHEADLVQGAVRPAGGPSGPFDRVVSAGEASGLFEAASLFVRREAFDRAGGFPAGLEPEGGAPFGEDVLFGWAAVRAGARTAFSAHAAVRHEVVPRGPAGYVRERLRRRLFPELVGRAPELRETLLWRRWFLTRRGAAFDLAALSVALAACRRSPAPLAGAAPYLALAALESARWGPRRAPTAAAVGLAADAAGATALLAGSLKARRLVL